jgi:hypothetical protein
MGDLTYDSDRLIREWRERYTGRRTIAAQMLDEAEVLVRDAIAREREQERREAKTAREYDLERRERTVEHAEQLHQQRIDRLTAQLTEAKAKVDELSSRRTLMREERETVEQGTVVRLLAPTEPLSWTNDKTSVRPWMLAELEDVTCRLRMAGGEDGTEVRFKRDAIEACVPFAEFALTPATPTPARRPEPNLPDPGRVKAGTPLWMTTQAIATALAGVAAIVLWLVVR